MRDLHLELQSYPATTDIQELWGKFPAGRFQQGIDKFIPTTKAGRDDREIRRLKLSACQALGCFFFFFFFFFFRAVWVTQFTKLGYPDSKHVKMANAFYKLCFVNDCHLGVCHQ